MQSSSVDLTIANSTFFPNSLQVFINFAKQQTDLAEDELEAAKASLRLSSSKNSSTPPESFIVEGQFPGNTNH